MFKVKYPFSLEEILDEIKEEFLLKEKTIKKLREENTLLRDEHYKDNEIAQLKRKLKKAQDDLNRGFDISKEEWAAIQEWHREHSHYSGAIGGNVIYIFTPTSIGTIGVVKCTSCGEEFCFRELN